MRIFGLILLAILALLSIAAGSAKVMQSPQEVAFFDQVGVDLFWLVPLGAAQIVGAILAIVPKTKSLGLIVIGLGFICSSLMIFATGNTSFGVFSLIPAGLCLAILLARARIYPTE